MTSAAARRSTKQPGGSVVVCLTDRGGHIEHAFNLGDALARATGVTSTVISRRGASEYLPVLAGVSVVHIGPFVEERTLLGKVRRTIHEARDVRRLLGSMPDQARVVLEEPVMALALPLRRSLDLVVVVHNVQDHDQLSGGLASGSRRLLKRLALARADRVIVHGQRQADEVSARFTAKVRAVELPGVGAFELARAGTVATTAALVPSDQLVCLGEIRPNKNYEEAIAAATQAGLPLVVAGLGVDPDYLTELRKLAADLRAAVTFVTDFLDADAFAAVVSTCRALVLPYRFFAAQSGVLERGLAAGAPVIVADLPALVEQAGGRPGVTVYPTGNTSALTAAMLETTPRRPDQVPQPGTIDERWETMARRILA